MVNVHDDVRKAMWEAGLRDIAWVSHSTQAMALGQFASRNEDGVRVVRFVETPNDESIAALLDGLHRISRSSDMTRHVYVGQARFEIRGGKVRMEVVEAVCAAAV